MKGLHSLWNELIYATTAPSVMFVLHMCCPNTLSFNEVLPEYITLLSSNAKPVICTYNNGGKSHIFHMHYLPLRLINASLPPCLFIIFFVLFFLNVDFWAAYSFLWTSIHGSLFNTKFWPEPFIFVIDRWNFVFCLYFICFLCFFYLFLC